jgi:predicted AAA+ superfamily ATPase
MWIDRHLTPLLQKSKKSILLLGPRQVGKSALISKLNPGLAINLALESTYLEFARDPDLLVQLIAGGSPRSILIDEIQRLPSLLNTLQVVIDKDPRLTFFLTGSSARKLRRGGANLLPGRIHTYRLGPLTSAECDYRMDERRALSTGSLPGIYSEEEDATRKKTLRSYVETYLREEVRAEALTRNLEGFVRFLDHAGACAGGFLDLSKLASSAQVPRQTAVRYFEILEDTLLVMRSEAFSKSLRRRLVQHPRFFFFDCGILNAVQRSFDLSGDRLGGLFEHLIFTQIVHSAHARDEEIRISSYRSSGGAEVDFIVEKERDVYAIEAKASKTVGPNDLRGIRSFREFFGKRCNAMIAYRGEAKRVLEDVEILPWQVCLQKMGF